MLSKYQMIVIISICFLISGSLPAQENLQVVSEWLEYTDTENALYHHLADQAYEYLEQRKLKVQGFQTQAEWSQYQGEIKEKLSELVGPFPEKTPLHPRIMDTIEKPDYRVEKIIFESQPRFYVTSVMLLPKPLDEKTPAIVYCSGHTSQGFRSETYQNVMINLVKKGFIVFAFDPIGQGERSQYFDQGEGESRIGGPTSEHSYAGTQCFLTGSSLARYMIWDGIRAVDYLLTRDEVDPKRIGITGRSGGGTQSAYIAAFDERIKAAAPENYITNFKYLLKTRGPQDAEQNFYHGIVNEIDQADLLEVRAPKPALMITTTRDIFNIQGSRDTYNEVARCYEAYDAGGSFGMVEDDFGHGSTEKNRIAMYEFFQKHLDLPGSIEDLKVEIFPEEELHVTKTGQVSTSLGGETVFSLHSIHGDKLHKSLQDSRKEVENHLETVAKKARELSGYVSPDEQISEIFTGRYQRSDYVVEKYYIQGEGDYPIPYLLMKPDAGGPFPLIVYLHPAGKTEEADPGGEIEWLVNQGYAVTAPDLLGIGEMGPDPPDEEFIVRSSSYTKWFASIQIGRSLAGVRAGDINRLVSTLTNRQDIQTDSIIGIARRDLTPTMLHAAAFNANFSNIVLIEPLVSYHSIVSNEYYEPGWTKNAVAGMLTAYDLPDLSAVIAPRKLVYINALDHSGELARGSLIRREFDIIRKSYGRADVRENFDTISVENASDLLEKLIEWLEQ